MKSILALAALALMSTSVAAQANDNPDFDFLAPQELLSEPEMQFDAELDASHSRHQVAVLFRVAAKGGSAEEARAGVNKAAAAICGKHKGAIRNISYRYFEMAKPRPTVEADTRKGMLGNVTCVVRYNHPK